MHFSATDSDEHVEDPNKLPILIFPEGTCINNTSVMQFKKGSFEVGGTDLPGGHQVRRQVRRRLLELLRVRHVALYLHDDDFLGHRLRRLVPPAHEEEGGRRRCDLRKSRESGNRSAGRPRRSRFGMTKLS